MNRAALLLGTGVLSLALSACGGQSLVGDEPQGDAGSDASSTSSAWACLGQGSVAPTMAQITVAVTAFNGLDAVTFTGQVDGGSDLTLASDTAFPGLMVLACNALDSACASPLATGTTDSNGLASLAVAGNFSGTFRLNGAGAVPTILWLGALPAGATTFRAPVPILETQGLSALEAALDTSPGSTLGHVFFEVYDCFDQLAAGVAVAPSASLGTEAVAWYAANNLPSATATETAATGNGGILNASPGAVSLTATLAGSSTTVGTANVVVEAQTITNVFFRARAH